MTSTPVGAGGVTDDVRGTRFHDDELTVDATLARRLVRRAFPEHAAHAVRPTGDTGSSNALFRLGDDLVVRLPRQPGGGASIAKEARWLPFVASRVTVSVPTVVGVGGPDLGYPERWAVTGWLEGSRATPPPRPRGSSHGLAADLARFVTEVRAMEVPDCAGTDPELSWYRGGPLKDLDADFRDAVEACRPLGPGLDLDLDLDEALRVWDRAVECSGDTAVTRAWFHGDLLAENLLLDDAGRLTAVLDFGGLAVGDPTVDLVVAWEALDEQGRHELRRALDVDDPAWTASRGWALLIALITVPYYGRTMPRRCSDRMAMARAALAGR